jgi:hypothetical protein
VAGALKKRGEIKTRGGKIILNLGLTNWYLMKIMEP